MQEERSRGEHNLTNVTKTQERVQAEKSGKQVAWHLSIYYLLFVGIHYNSKSVRAHKFLVVANVSTIHQDGTIYVGPKQTYSGIQPDV